MKTSRLFIIVSIFFAAAVLYPQSSNRKNIIIPDLPGYKTLKCDFHMHTVFSDGNVWPTLRVDEAWMDGLDAIAITDHLEYRPHKDYIQASHNSSYKIALSRAKNYGLTLIHGSEITRSMPPGHMNALFITDSDSLIKDDWKAVAEEVKKQGGLIVWNHPGWSAQQPDGIAKWYKEHDFLLENGIMKGIEIVNETNYYPNVFQWSIDKNITIFGNTDIHAPIIWEYPAEKPVRRTITLVFAKDNSVDAIREAILEHRTAVFSNNILYGKQEYLSSIYQQSIKQSTDKIKIKGKGRAYVQIQNVSDVPYDFELADTIKTVKFPKSFKLGPRESFNMEIQSTGGSQWSSDYEVLYKIKNLLISPDKYLPVSFKLNITLGTDKE